MLNRMKPTSRTGLRWIRSATRSALSFSAPYVCARPLGSISATVSGRWFSSQNAITNLAERRRRPADGLRSSDTVLGQDLPGFAHRAHVDDVVRLDHNAIGVFQGGDQRHVRD